MKKLRSKVQSEALGMDYGTAYNILRKKVIFMLIQKAGIAICYRCKTELTDPDTTEIDHIEDWETSEEPLELFLDINNISFSHAICNNLAKTKIGKSGYIGVTITKNKKIHIVQEFGIWCNRQVKTYSFCSFEMNTFA